MPNSWTEKKKKRMNGLHCKVKPDTDNITKAVKDALKKQDSEVWYEKAEKRWAFKGSILIYG
jgi:Holliday junction resolvase RusA-like endonuclease